MNAIWKKSFVIAVIVVGLCLIFLASLAALNRHNQAAGLNQEIRYDDFAFSVQRVRKTDSLGSGTNIRKARGTYCIVTIKVANHAKRIDYQFNNEAVILIDGAGREYRISAEGQDALESRDGYIDPCAARILAGEECVTEVVFDVPANISDLSLKFSEGGPLGDILDAIFKKRIKIGPLD
ncbi:MAG: DUF4352 domain-containing protein [Blastocatellia bacterium]|nr:DUF4352 domain-containing protein [Blastocatellia bacterium]